MSKSITKHLAILIVTSTTFLVTHLVQCNCDVKENYRILNESVTKYGAPQGYRKYNLPGPQIDVGENKLDKAKTHFETGQNYTLKYRRISEHFSYIQRYEIRRATMNDTVVDMKGQISEIIHSKDPSCVYIRTLGYKQDVDGFRLFLSDVSKVVTKRGAKKAASKEESTVRPGFLGISANPFARRDPFLRFG